MLEYEVLSENILDIYKIYVNQKWVRRVYPPICFRLSAGMVKIRPQPVMQDGFSPVSHSDFHTAVDTVS